MGSLLNLGAVVVVRKFVRRDIGTSERDFLERLNGNYFELEIVLK